MPLPFLLPGLLFLLGGLGAGAAIKGAVDNSEANDLNGSAESIFDEAQKKLKGKRKKTAKKLKDLGQLKIETWQNQMGSFIKNFERIKNVELNQYETSEGRLPTHDELEKMKEISASCAEVLGGGIASLSAGALAGFAAYGGATMFAAASTGTAISSLTGVAATNATLAWFGGGSLAAGGLGMTGGVAILGGVVAAPVLLIAGGLFAASSSSKLSKARENIAQAREAASEMDAAGAILDAIKGASDIIEAFIHSLTPAFEESISGMRSVIKKSGTNFELYNSQQKEKIYFAVEFANLMKRVLETPILKKDGSLSHKIKSDIKKLHNSSSKLLGEDPCTEALLMPASEDILEAEVIEEEIVPRHKRKRLTTVNSDDSDKILSISQSKRKKPQTHSFYDVKMKSKIIRPITSKAMYGEYGNERYAVMAQTQDGRELTAFVSKADWEAIKDVNID